MKNITKAQATKVLNAVIAQCKSTILAGAEPPVLRMDWEIGATIIWEEGPYQWTYLFPYGGIDEEYGFRVKDVSASIPKGVWCEPQTSYSLSIYLDN